MIEVSIIIPTLNSASTILPTLNSIINQTFKNWEIIVVDSNSRDNTRNLILSKKNKKIKFYNCKQKKLSLVRLFGIEKAKGRYIAFCDSDDLWNKNKLYQQIMFMKFFRKKFSCTSYIMFKPLNKIYIKVPNKISLNQILKDRPIALSSVVIDKFYCKKILKTNVDYNYAEDYIWWLALLKKQYCYGLHNYYTYIRVRRESRSSDIASNFRSLFKIYRNYMKLSYFKVFIILIFLIKNTLKKNIFKYKEYKILK